MSLDARPPRGKNPKLSPAERAQIRQLIQYLLAIILFVILTGLIVGVVLNLSN
ncbi:MAG: hypothetical protein OXF83_03270 [Anaerolineaceae bacterium]|nr:hypothetical protein [Anaerolineaceae bacterium]MCY4008732.1 hypothetical protein [Anaerolineaceae bacterium]MCY4106899.1 hypothetical protein [Chloroflexota bacterium]